MSESPKEEANLKTIRFENYAQRMTYTDAGLVIGCAKCWKLFNQDDLEMTKRTGTCPYCSWILTEARIK